MNDIDRQLHNLHSAEPRRPLSATFTVDTYKKIQTRPRGFRSWRQASYLQGVFSMRSLPKKIALGLGVAAVTLTTGSAVANIFWHEPQVSLKAGSLTTLESGNQHFALDVKNCQGQGGYSATNYYEIKAGSALTPAELTKAIEASCEPKLQNEQFPEIAKASVAYQDFKPGTKQYFVPTSVTIKSIGDKTITVDTMLNGKSYKNVTLPLNSKIKVYSKDKQINLKDLRAGNIVTLVTATTSLDKPFATEMIPEAELAKLSKDGFPIGARVEGAIVEHYSQAKFNEVFSRLGTDWTRLEADKNSPNGWRQISPLKN